MRAGPLSDAKVIELLNTHFVPVFISNEDYAGKQPAVPPDEVKAHQRIYHEALREKRDAGSVCVYLVAPDGDGFASLIVSEAAKPKRLQAVLEQAIAKHGTRSGKPLAEPRKQSQPPVLTADSLLLHLVSRYDRRGSWAEFPAENWIVLTPAEWQKLLPPADGTNPPTWGIDAEVAGKLLTLFFPQTEVCTFGKLTDADGPYKHRLEEHKLGATLLSTRDGIARIRLDGRVRLRHKFYPNHEDEHRAVSTVLGYMEIDTRAGKIKKFRLATSEATYAKWPFTVAVREGP